MATKVISFSDKTIDVPSVPARKDAEGRQSMDKKNLFLVYLTHIIEQTTHKNDTDAFLSHSLREKVDAVNGELTIELEEAEIEFVRNGLTKLQQTDRVAGSEWYHVIKPLREAEDKKTFERKQKKSEAKKE